MVKLIKRRSDNKFLVSSEDNTWSDSISEALLMTYHECESIKELLLNSYSIEDLKEIVDFSKRKPMTLIEAREIRNLLKK